MGYLAGGRRGDRRGADPQLTRDSGPRAGTGRILMAATGPGAAAVLLGEETGPGPVTVLCLEAGSVQERAAFDRAAEEAAGRGCPVDGAPRPLPAEDLGRALLRELRAASPDRVLTCDPLALREEGGEAESSLAMAVLDAVEAYQTETGRPVFTDCRVLDPRAWPAPASRPRYPAPAAWAVCGTDGRVSAYLPVPGAVARWTEGADGSWSGPVLLEVPRLLPVLTVVQDPDGYANLIGLRRTAAAEGAGTSRSSTRSSTSRAAPGPLVHPDEPAPGRAAARTLHRGARGRLRRRRHDARLRPQRQAQRERLPPAADGTWSGWGLLRGAKVADEMVALRGPNGKVELYARHRDQPGAARWHRGPDGKWAVDLSPNVHALPGSLAAVPEDGALRYRYSETGELCQWPLGAYGPLSLNAPAVRGRAAGAAGVAIGGWSCTVLAAEDEQGHCVIGTYVDGRLDGGVWWIATDQRTLMPPEVIRKHDGTVIVVTLGPGGSLVTMRQVANGQALEFEPWLDLA